MPSKLYATSLPAEIKASIASAYKTSDQFIKTAVINRVKQEYPESIKELEIIIANLETPENNTKQKTARTPSVVEEAPKTKKQKSWKGEVGLGINSATGNTETQDINIAGKLEYEKKHWGNSFEIKFINNNENDRTTAEEYRASNQSRYNFTKKDYGFLELDYVKDRFSGFDSRYSETLGYGHKLYNTDDFKLAVEAGLGLRQSNLTNGDNKNDFTQELGNKLDWKINKNLSFSENIKFSFSDNTIMEMETALKSNIVDNFFLKLGFDLEYVSDVPQGRKKTDTLTSINLVYEY